MKLKKINYLRFGEIFILVLMLFYFSYLNSSFTDSFYTVGIREIDDQAFLYSINERFRQLKLLNISNFIGNNDYGYGIFYWLSAFISAIPGFLLNSTKLIIFGPRFLSAFSFIVGSYFLCRVIEKNIYHKLKFLSLFGLLGLFLPSTLYAALRFHNRGLIFLLISISLYYLLNEEINFYRRIRISIIFQFLAIGTSLFAISTLPIFLLTVFDIYKIEKIKNNLYLKNFSKYIKNTFYLSIVTYFLAYQPKFFLFPFFIREIYVNLRNTISVILRSKNMVNLNQYDYLWTLKETLSHYFQIYFLILLAFISLFLIILKKKNLLQDSFMEASKNTFFIGQNNSISYGILWFLFYSFILCLMVRQPPIGLSNYLIALTPYILLSLADQFTLLIFSIKNKKKNIFIFLSITSLLILNPPLDIDLFKQYSNQYNTENKIAELVKYSNYSECLKIIFNKNKNKEKILHVAANYSINIPCSSIDNTCFHQSIFGKYPNISETFKPDVIIFDNGNNFYEYVNENKEYIKKYNDTFFDDQYIFSSCRELRILSKK